MKGRRRGRIGLLTEGEEGQWGIEVAVVGGGSSDSSGNGREELTAEAQAKRSI